MNICLSSFSYRTGLPKEEIEGEHGGGFVCDCRLLSNPGLTEEFHYKTGNDKDVKEWLQRTEEYPAFLLAVSQVVTLTINSYLLKGYTSLRIAFGCTGGQHRSVAVANAIKDFIESRYEKEKVSVSLRHYVESTWPVKPKE